MFAAIRQWVIKTMMKGQTGVVRTLPKNDLIELNTQITAERIMRNGINPEDLKTVGQVENVVNQIEQPKVNVNPGMTSVKKADVMDMEGNKIPEGSKIMGGKQVESDAAIKARLDAGNKKGIASIKNKPLDPDVVLPDYNETPGAFARRNTPGSKENLLQELKIAYEKDFNKLRGDETVEELKAILKNLDTDGEPFADGGRIGFKGGADMGTVADSKGNVGAKSVSVSPSGSVTTSNQAPSGPDDKGSPTQNLTQYLVNQSLSPKEIRRITGVDKPSAIDKIKNSPYNNPFTRGILRAGAYTLNPSLGALDFRKAMQLKGLYDTTMDSINYPDEDDMTLGLMTDKQKDIIDRQMKMGDAFDPDATFESAKIFDDKGETKTLGIFGEDRPAEPMTREEFDNYVKEKGYATGGIARANFVGGGMGRRGFLKMLAGLGGGIAAAKTGLLKFAGKGAGKEVAKEVVQKSTSTPPPYFFKLAEKIKMMGDDATATTDRTIAKTLKSKDGKSTYLLEEDVTTGDTIIKKINKEGDEMITDVEIMELKKGEVVMGKDGKPIRVPDEYEEVTEANARIEGDTFNDPYYSDGIQVDEIIKEVDDKVPSIKYATGGRVPYFKGGLAALKTLMNYFAKEKGTTGSKLLSDINPKKIDSGIKNLMSKEELNQLKENRTEYVKHLLNIIKSDKKFLDNNRAIVEETIAQAPIGMEDIAKEISDSIKRNAMKENRLERLSVYDKVNPDDAIMDVEMMIKNMSTGKKDKRALNAKGGLAYMLGE